MKNNGFIISEGGDLVILSKTNELEKLKLKKGNKNIAILTKNQLKKEWRQPLIDYLNLLLKRYKK